MNIEDYKKNRNVGSFSQDNGSAGGTDNGDTQPSSSSATEDYYKMAREQEYGALLDKEVQLENAKANALKYTKNTINASGFGGTGYGSSTQAGVYNDYLNRLGSATSEYNANIKSINQSEKEALETESANRTGNITTMLTNASSVEQMNNLLKEYGYGDYNESGEFVLNEQKPANMTDDEWIQLKYYYNAQKDGLSSGVSGINAFSLGDSSLVAYDKNGNATTITSGSDFTAELSTLNANYKAGALQNGSYIKLATESGNTLYCYYKDGQFYYVTPQEYENKEKEGQRYAVSGYGKLLKITL